MIGVCKWNESGTTIETALPELSTLTDDKEEWRAVIVRFIDDNCMASYQSTSDNPFDFLVNQNNGDAIHENQVPLVRLTQMLGGVPPLEVKFRPEIRKDDHKLAKTVYTPYIDEENERERQALVNKYKFDGKAPSSIIVITTRELTEEKENDIGRAWVSHRESDSSTFWKKNNYPSLCRFLVYDYKKRGVIQKDADNLNFWLSVLLLSTNDPNDVDSSILQAYRIYTVKTILDKAKMADSFQLMADRLRDAKLTLERDIKKDLENEICDEKALPQYSIDVPVDIKIPEVEKREVSKRIFHIFSEGASTDTAVWNSQSQPIREAILSSVRSAERKLDKTADKMRGSCTIMEEEVEPLNKYQEEDMLRETDALFHRVVALQSSLPTDKVFDDDELEEASDAVKENLICRVMKKPAFISFFIVSFDAGVPIFLAYALINFFTLSGFLFVSSTLDMSDSTTAS